LRCSKKGAEAGRRQKRWDQGFVAGKEIFKVRCRRQGKRRPAVHPRPGAYYQSVRFGWSVGSTFRQRPPRRVNKVKTLDRLPGVQCNVSDCQLQGHQLSTGEKGPLRQGSLGPGPVEWKRRMRSTLARGLVFCRPVARRAAAVRPSPANLGSRWRYKNNQIACGRKARRTRHSIRPDRQTTSVAGRKARRGK
jgi:hypothetical protein